MSLYNDSLLADFILHEAPLPDSAKSVAISLADPERGPFIIVTRTGHFVTCLDEDMRVEPGTPGITRQHLDSIVGEGGGHPCADRAGASLSASRPLMGREFLLQLVDAVLYLDDARHVLRKLDNPPRRYEGLLRECWNVVFHSAGVARPEEFRPDGHEGDCSACLCRDAQPTSACGKLRHENQATMV